MSTTRQDIALGQAQAAAATPSPARRGRLLMRLRGFFELAKLHARTARRHFVTGTLRDRRQCLGAFDAIERFYAGGSGRHWILVNDHSRPHDLARQLIARGYKADGAWERVVLQADDAAHHAARWAAHGLCCELVTRHSAAEWSGFLLSTYGMPPPIGPWLATAEELASPDELAMRLAVNGERMQDRDAFGFHTILR